MTFEDVLIETSSVREAKLYGPSLKARENPLNGVTLQNPAAEHVIRDCATIARDFIPVIVFMSYGHPFKELNKRFTKEQIVDLVNRSNTNIGARALMQVILWRGSSIPLPPLQKSAEKRDPYGDYSDTAPTTQVETVNDKVLLLGRLFGLL